MSFEDEIKQLREKQKAREENYTKFKGMLEGLRLTKLTETDKTFLTVIEAMADNFKATGDNLVDLYERQIRIIQTLDNLVKQVEQMKAFQDTLEKNR
jgi:hypothetical protein